MTATTRPPKQEQQPADPTVTEVAPGVVRMQLPIRLPGLGHVNCYALIDGDGIAVVDPGLPGPESWSALVDRLAQIDAQPRHIHTIVITHSHPDHYGGAHQLRAETGARIVTHRLFRNWWDPAEDGEILDDAGMEEAGHIDAAEEASGGPPGAGFRMDGDRTPWGGAWYGSRAMSPTRDKVMGLVDPAWFDTPAPTVGLRDAETVTLAGRPWVAVHTPGHTPDHLCLFDPTEGVMLSGDHVLPTITPHISGISAGADPLRRFFTSLDRMAEFEGVRTVLPAHGHPFDDLVGRAEAIRHHHEGRLQVLRQASAALGPATVEALSHELFAERSWGPMAESETYAHLEHLRLCGDATTDEAGGRLRFVVR